MRNFSQPENDPSSDSLTNASVNQAMRRIECKRIVQRFVVENFHINSLPGAEKFCNFNLLEPEFYI